MQQFEIPNIKYRPDGSIDTAHYLKNGRQNRAQQARILAARLIAVILLVSPAKAIHEES